MIAYDLQCINGHSFEGWFKDATAYEEQGENALIACPVCSSTSIARIPSTFSIKSSTSLKEFADSHAHLMKIHGKIVDFVEKNFDDVGSEFAKEALKMHYGVSESRSIRGVSTEEEEKTLKDEGIEFFKVPMPTRPETDA